MPIERRPTEGPVSSRIAAMKLRGYLDPALTADNGVRSLSDGIRIPSPAGW
jgi:hypothetical protein